jgi:dsDNA-specific endonuclease/ATPase MutS2
VKQMGKLSDKAKHVIHNLENLNKKTVEMRDDADRLCKEVNNLEGKTSDSIYNLMNPDNSIISNATEDHLKYLIEREKFDEELRKLKRQRKKGSAKSKPKRCTCMKKR